MIVQLAYFKAYGKFHSESEYRTKHKDLCEIWGEVRTMQREGKLPGLSQGGGSDFLILVGVPDHSNDRPRLIVPGFEPRCGS